MKRLTWPRLLVSGCVIGLAGTAAPLPETREAQQSSFPAFTLHVDSFSAGKDGGKSKMATHMRAQRSDGVQVQITEHEWRRVTLKKRVIRYPDRTITVDDAGMLTTTLATYPGPRIDPASGCTKAMDGTAQVYRVDGHELVLGIDTVRTVLDGGSRRITDWLAPSLGCQSVKSLIADSKTGALVASNEPTAIELGEPEKSLFAIAPGYKEVDPADAAVASAKRMAAAAGKTLPAAEELKIRNQGAGMNDLYHAKRP